MKRLLSACLVVVWLTFAACASAEPFIEHVEPPAVCRGQQNTLAIVGHEVDRAIDLWTSLPAGKFKVAGVVSSHAERSEFKIDVAADCPLGVYGLRIATEDGLSNLHLFVVDDLAPRTSLSNPQAEFPVSVAGQLRPAEVHRYPLAVQANQRLSFEVVASRLGNDADPLITIYDPNGRRVVQRDNDPGLFFDCSFEHAFLQGGTYTVEVRDARFLGSPHWRYLLRMGNFPAAYVALPSAVMPGEKTLLKFPQAPGVESNLDTPADQPPGGFFYAFRRAGDAASSWIPLLSSPLPNIVEAEPNDAPDQATPAAESPLMLHGVLESTGDKDYFAFDLKKGQRLTVRAETKPLHSPADVELIIVDPTGKEIQRVDDTTLPGGALDEGALTFNVGQDGKYCVLVRELTKAFGPEFTYRVTVQPVTPRIQIVAETSALSIPQEGYQSLPFTVTRTDFAGPVELSLVGGPAGLTLEPSVIPEGENNLLCKLSASSAAPLGLQQLQILAKGQAGDVSVSAPVITQPLVDRQIVNVDLIKHGLRDNQRWLPASVTDKLAIQVLPPAPFAIDLADSKITLPRYQQVEVPVQIARRDGFAGEISFTATGTQQLGEESQGRRQVFYRFPVATADKSAIAGTIHSRSQANEGTERVEFCAVAKQGTRSVYLKRSAMLAIKPAFEVEIEPNKLQLSPGGKATIKLNAQRMPTFSGEITIDPSTSLGVTLPATITIPAASPSVEVEVAVAPDGKPRKERIRFVASAPVNGFQEEPRPKELEIEIKEPPKETPAAK